MKFVPAGVLSTLNFVPGGMLSALIFVPGSVLSALNSLPMGCVIGSEVRPRTCAVLRVSNAWHTVGRGTVQPLCFRQLGLFNH